LSTERFGGQTPDTEVQQAYFHARQFQSRTGRFAAPDSIFEVADDPQHWNRYSYALNQPQVFGDFSGLCPIMIRDKDGHWIDPCPFTSGNAPGNLGPGPTNPEAGGHAGGWAVTRPDHERPDLNDDREPRDGRPKMSIIPPLVGDERQVRVLRQTFVDVNKTLQKSKCNGLFGGAFGATSTLMSVQQVRVAPLTPLPAPRLWVTASLSIRMVRSSTQRARCTSDFGVSQLVG
jgi:RHS repeat-associated protein